MIEIIPENRIEVENPEYISAVEAASLLKMSRQWVSTLMKSYVESGGYVTIPCVVIGGQYFTTESQLRDYYENKVKKFATDPRKYFFNNSV